MSYDAHNVIDDIEDVLLRRAVLGAYRPDGDPHNEPTVQQVVPVFEIGRIIYEWKKRWYASEGEDPPPPPRYPTEYDSSDWEEKALEAWRRAGSDKKIQAIKEFRTMTGAGLKQSKDAIESVERLAKETIPTSDKIKWDEAPAGW